MAKIFIINDASITGGVASTSDVGTTGLRWKDGWFSGLITMGSASISGSIIGGSGTFSGTVTAGTLSAAGAGIFGTTVTATTGSFSGAIIAATSLTVGTVSATGNVIVGGLSSIAGQLIVTGSSTIGGLTFTDNRSVTLGTGTGTTFATATNQKLSFYGVTAVVQPTALTATVGTVTFSEPTTPDYAIQDMTQVTPYGFVTLDEGQSILKVIANLQVRVNQLEDKLQDLGLIA